MKNSKIAGNLDYEILEGIKVRQWFCCVTVVAWILSLSPDLVLFSSAAAADVSWSQTLAQANDTAPVSGSEGDAQSSEPEQEDYLDLVPPVIEHDNDVSGVPGEPMSIKVIVSDNAGVGAVTLYHRASASDDFQKILMSPAEGSSTTYVSTIETEPTQSEIHYYIEAEDVGGNRVFNGYPFRPIIFTMVQPVDDVPSTKRSNATRILLGVAGAVAVGLLLSSGGGSSGGSDNSATLNLNVAIP